MKVQEERNELKKKILSKKEPELNILENVKSVHIAKNKLQSVSRRKHKGPITWEIDYGIIWAEMLVWRGWRQCEMKEDCQAA